MEQYQHLFNLNRRMYDSTVIRTYLECPKRFEYRWIRRIAPVNKSLPMIFGSLFHEALLIWYTSKDVEKAKKVFNELPKFVEDESRTRERAALLLDKYIERWKDEPYKIRELEVEFHIMMKGGSIFAGRMDALIDWMNGTYVKDHKTSRILGLTFFRGFRPHFQIDGYCYACRELTGSCMGAIINGIQVCKTKMAFEKKISSRTEGELNSFPIEYEKIVGRLEEDILKKSFFKNTSQCHHYGGCPYIDLCTYGDDEISSKFKIEKIKELDNGCTVVLDT